MTEKPARGRRRSQDALSREVVVDAAVTLLDERGERGFTFPLLTKHLHTGNGAIYWHVANKDELIALAADQVLAEAVTAADEANTDEVVSGAPEDRVRVLAVGVYDALDRHQWAAAHVTGTPTPPHALRIMERIGQLTDNPNRSAEEHFVIATAIYNYVIGVAAQMIGAGATIGQHTNRSDYLAQSAERWQQLDPAEYPFLSGMTDTLRDHDDRAQYIAGLDLLINGLTERRTDS